MEFQEFNHHPGCTFYFAPPPQGVTCSSSPDMYTVTWERAVLQPVNCKKLTDKLSDKNVEPEVLRYVQMMKFLLYKQTKINPQYSTGMLD